MLICLGVCIYKISIVIRILWYNHYNPRTSDHRPRNHDFIASTAEGRLIRLLVRSQRHKSESSYRVNWKIFASIKKRGFFWGNVNIDLYILLLDIIFKLKLMKIVEESQELCCQKPCLKTNLINKNALWSFMVFCENDKCKRSSVREWFCDSKMLVSFIFLFLKFGCVHHETPIGVGFIQDLSPKNSSTWNPPRGVSWHLQLGRGITVIPRDLHQQGGQICSFEG